MVTAALRSLFAQETAEEIKSRWDDLATSLAERFLKAAALMHGAKEAVLTYSCGEDFVYRHIPKDHWNIVWSTNLVGRVNEESKRRSRLVGNIPNDDAIIRLVGAVLLEQLEHWQLEGRRMFSAENMATIPELGDSHTLQALSARKDQAKAPGDRGCTDQSSSQHIRDRTKDLTRQSLRFIVPQGGTSAPLEASPSFHPVPLLIRTFEPQVLHRAKGLGPRS